jgi:hypothetical protein
MVRPDNRQKRRISWRIIKTNFDMLIQQEFRITGQSYSRGMLLSLIVLLLLLLSSRQLMATEPATAQVTSVEVYLDEIGTTTSPGYDVQRYVIQSKTPLATNDLATLFSKYTGTNVSLQQIVHAAADLDWQYAQQGYENMTILIAPKHISEGVVTLDVFPGAVAQILVAGNRYLISSNILASRGDATLLRVRPGTCPDHTAAAATSKVVKKACAGISCKKIPRAWATRCLPPVNDRGGPDQY